MKKTLLVATLFTLSLNFNVQAGTEEEEIDKTAANLKKLTIRKNSPHTTNHVKPSDVQTTKRVRPTIRKNDASNTSFKSQYSIPATPIRKGHPTSDRLIKKLVKSGRFELRNGQLWQKPQEDSIPVKSSEF